MSAVRDVLAAAPAPPGRPALWARDPAAGAFRAVSREELEEAVDRRAGALAREGVRAGHVHPVALEPDAEGVATLLACWRLGAVPAPLNPRLTAAEGDEARRALAGRDGGGAQVVLWTSGTSGRPRGVSLSWDALATHVDAAGRRLGLDPARDTWLASLALAHVGGLMVVVRALVTGSGLVAPGPVGSGELAVLLGPAGEGRPPTTHASLVPTQLLRLLDDTGAAPPPPTLRCLLLGGAHTPAGLLHRAVAAGWPVFPTYGMTEMASQVATATPELVRRKPGSVGAPLDGVEVRIGEGEEILARGPTRALGYLDGTPLTDADGWVHTGDLGRVDEDGHLWVTGRRVERIVTGGVNVDALEVEEVLRSHPAVADACVVGVPDDEWGEVVGVCVVPVAGEFDEDAVGDWLRERLQAAKRPRLWWRAAALPLNANGKVDRLRVRALLAGGQEGASRER